MEDRMLEIWKDIKGYEGIYQVSNFGNVKRLSGYVQFGHVYMHPEKPVYRFISEHIMKTYIHKNGYEVVKLNGYPYSVHRLVALAFIPNPENKPEVDHIDNNRLNNNLSNLRWATSIENKNNSNSYKNRHASNCFKGKHWKLVNGKRVWYE